jgi:hypothetical protein
VILHCDFEELRALASGVEAVLTSPGVEAEGGIAAATEAIATLETLLPRLTGDLSVETLAEQRQLQAAVAAVHADLHLRLDRAVVQSGPASEESVATYFDYAYVGLVLDRLERMGAEMADLVELITGAPPSAEAARSVTFPD